MRHSTDRNLNNLLKDLLPKLNHGDYVFCSVTNNENISNLNIIASFLEEEGISILLSKEMADKANFNYSSILSWITLSVFSDLEAVGLTAAVSSVLAENNISCNVIAAFNHDHIFVPKRDANQAMDLLKELSSKSI